MFMVKYDLDGMLPGKEGKSQVEPNILACHYARSDRGLGVRVCGNIIPQFHLPLHVGVGLVQVPSSLQVVFLDPSSLYPGKQANFIVFEFPNRLILSSMNPFSGL